MQLKFTTAVLLSFVLIGLTACGGSGKQATIDQLEADLVAAEEAREAAAEQAAEAERQRQEEESAREAAEIEAAKAKQEAEEAETAREAAEEAVQGAEEAQQQAQQAQQQLQQEQQQNQQLQQQLTEAEQAELRARAGSFGAQLDAPELGPATVSWTRGNKLTFKPQGTLDPGSAAPSVPGGWRSASFTGHSGTANALVDETVYLYTNIQAPSSRAFWKVHNVEVAAQSATALTTDADNNDPTPTAAARYITDPGDNTMATGVQVSGTYDGVSGTFTCIAGGCTGLKTDITLTSLVGDPVSGVRSFAGGDWSFKPGSITALVKAEDQADQDDAFLYFGVWSSIPDSITGTYNFRYLAGGGAETGSGSDFATKFATLTGPATFRGGAVGRYVTQGQVGGQNAKIGTFTATATLNADFTANTISGSITDFREDGSALAGWRVTLGSGGNVGTAAPIGADAAVATQENGTVANIGGLSVGGSWGATFYGSGNEVLLDRDKYPASRYPPVDLAGVVGWFDATGPGAGTDPNDVAVAGAFAATPSN